MTAEERVLCASSAYDEKYYFNPLFDSLPSGVKEELRIMTVMLTAQVGGIFTMSFEEDGELYLSTTAHEGDLLYDEIGAGLKVKELRKVRSELLEGLTLYYQSFFLDKNGKEAK